jgi:hypothetical protein
MLLAMTSRTNRHQLVIVVFTGAIGVKNLVALLTREAVLAPGGLQVVELAHVALSTICGLQRSRCHTVKGRINLWQLTLSGRNEPRLEKSSQGNNTS